MPWTRPFIPTEHPQAQPGLNLGALLTVQLPSSPRGTAAFDARGLQTAADKAAAGFVKA